MFSFILIWTVNVVVDCCCIKMLVVVAVLLLLPIVSCEVEPSLQEVTIIKTLLSEIFRWQFIIYKTHF